MTVTYVVYEGGWPVCTGPLDYVCRKTGRSKASLANKHRQTFKRGGFERVELDESELERKWPK